MANNARAERGLDRAGLAYSYEDGGITVHLGGNDVGRMPPSAATAMTNAGYEFIGATLKSYGVDLKFMPSDGLGGPF